MDKLLGRTKQKPPVVGEDKPTSSNLPDIASKNIARDLLSRLTVGSKKPTYTSVLKDYADKKELRLRKAIDTFKSFLLK